MSESIGLADEHAVSHASGMIPRIFKLLQKRSEWRCSSNGRSFCGFL